MHVFLDDSTSTRRPGYQCFAGFLSEEAGFNALGEDWRRLLAHHDLSHLHTSDFLSARGDHRNVSSSYEERKIILANFIEVIRRTMQSMIVVGIQSTDLYAYNAKARGGLGAVGFCLQRIVRICHRRLEDFTSSSPLNFVFDDSEKDAPTIYSAWAKLKKRHQIPKGLCASITFADDSVFYPLQAADLLACAVVQENQKPVGQQWGADSPFAPLVVETRESPLTMTVDQEYWDDSAFRRHNLFQA